MTAAEKAVRHVLQQISENPDVSYLLGPSTESFELLTAAEAERLGVSQDAVKEAVLEAELDEPRITVLEREIEELVRKGGCPSCGHRCDHCRGGAR